jgi:hypothetical protein
VLVCEQSPRVLLQEAVVATLERQVPVASGQQQQAMVQAD